MYLFSLLFALKCSALSIFLSQVFRIFVHFVIIQLKFFQFFAQCIGICLNGKAGMIQKYLDLKLSPACRTLDLRYLLVYNCLNSNVGWLGVLLIIIHYTIRGYKTGIIICPHCLPVCLSCTNFIKQLHLNVFVGRLCSGLGMSGPGAREMMHALDQVENSLS